MCSSAAQYEDVDAPLTSVLRKALGSKYKIFKSLMVTYIAMPDSCEKWETSNLPPADILACLCQKVFSEQAYKYFGGLQPVNMCPRVCGIILVENKVYHRGVVVALGTGNVCLLGQYWQSDGKVLHDTHCEVMAKRSFRKFLYAQIEQENSGQPSIFVRTPEGKLRLHPSLSVHMYMSYPPCGDATECLISDPSFNFGNDDKGHTSSESMTTRLGLAMSSCTAHAV